MAILPEKEVIRKRKTHKKSRSGCPNCKIRRVKCDEGKPYCRKCTESGYSCNYNSKSLELEMAFDGRVSFQTTTITKPTLSPLDRSQICKIPTPLQPTIISDNRRLDREVLDRLGRFHNRTLLTVGAPGTIKLFQDNLTELVFNHEYLMHIVQTLTISHDRYLDSQSHPSSPLKKTYPPRTLPEVHHLSVGASLFNRKLSFPVNPSVDGDALWSAAALLGVTAMCMLDATIPAEAWPLKPSEPSDLEWLKLSEMKMVIWDITDPTRPDSIFSAQAKEMQERFGSRYAGKERGIEGILGEFIELFGLGEETDEGNNPYYGMVRQLVPRLNEECTREQFLSYLSMLSHMAPAFKQLLRLKDPRALLLMGFWYGKVGDTVWWIERRARLEGQAICIYLKKFHGDDMRLMGLLDWLRRMIGMVG